MKWYDVWTLNIKQKHKIKTLAQLPSISILNRSTWNPPLLQFFYSHLTGFIQINFTAQPTQIPDTINEISTKSRHLIVLWLVLVGYDCTQWNAVHCTALTVSLQTQIAFHIWRNPVCTNVKTMFEFMVIVHCISITESKLIRSKVLRKLLNRTNRHMVLGNYQNQITYYLLLFLWRRQ